MRLSTLAAVVFSFAAGSYCTLHFSSAAKAETQPLQAALIDVNALQEADLQTTPLPDFHSKNLVVTEQATIAVQIGNVAKHFHAQSDEIQYIVEGTGTAWLGDKVVAIKPGMLLIIPKGTAHAGTVATSGKFKSIAIKIPPQIAGDTTFVK
jgi:mannose-6-phosphate isomerase-like protein (cupin superfamily)